jgi:hypothetical protein
MTESASIGISNQGKKVLRVNVEPWGETFILQTAQSKQLEGRGGKGKPWFNLVCSDDSVQLYVENAEEFVLKDA